MEIRLNKEQYIRTVINDCKSIEEYDYENKTYLYSYDFSNLPESVKKDVVKGAVKEDERAIIFLTDELENDIDFLTECAEENENILEFIKDEDIRQEIEDNLCMCGMGM